MLRELVRRYARQSRERLRKMKRRPTMVLQQINPAEQYRLACEICGHRILGWELSPMVEPSLPCEWRCSGCGVINLVLDVHAPFFEQLAVLERQRGED